MNFHGKKIVLVALSIFAITACSSSKYKTPDCFDCTMEPQSWKEFSWNKLEGAWQGSLQKLVNEKNAKAKERKEETVTLTFVNGEKFFSAQGITSCGNFPTNAVVLLGQAWANTSSDKTFEVFSEAASDKVSYGRAKVVKAGGENTCTYARQVGEMMRDALSSSRH